MGFFPFLRKIYILQCAAAEKAKCAHLRRILSPWLINIKQKLALLAHAWLWYGTSYNFVHNRDTVYKNVFFSFSKRSISSSKAWVIKNRRVPEILCNIKSTILMQSSWYFSNMNYSWGCHFDKVSLGWRQNCGFFIIGQFLDFSDF